MQYLFLVILFGAMYFLVLRPRAKAQQNSRKSGLVVGDDVVSNGGIFGVVVKSYDQRVWVEIAPSVEVIFDRRSLTRLDSVVVDAMEDAEAKMDFNNSMGSPQEGDVADSTEAGDGDSSPTPHEEGADASSQLPGSTGEPPLSTSEPEHPIAPDETGQS